MIDINELTFMRINKPDLFVRIPKRLFEQVKDNTFDIDKMYKLVNAFIYDPAILIFVLVDMEFKIKGLLWAEANLLDETIRINILSVDKEYQFSDALKKTLEFVRSWQGKDENLKIQFMTTRPDIYEKATKQLGIDLKHSKQIVMEIKGDTNKDIRQ